MLSIHYNFYYYLLFSLPGLLRSQRARVGRERLRQGASHRPQQQGGSAAIGSDEAEAQGAEAERETSLRQHV